MLHPLGPLGNQENERGERREIVTDRNTEGGIVARTGRRGRLAALFERGKGTGRPFKATQESFGIREH